MSNINRKNDQPLSLRAAFENAAVVIGSAAAVGMGLTPYSSRLQTAAAVLMGVAFGAAYVLKK